MLSENTRPELQLSQSEQFFILFIKKFTEWKRNKSSFIVRNWSRDMHGNKTQDTENLRDCPKVCVKNTDFYVCATAAVSFNSSFFYSRLVTRILLQY